MQVYLNNIAYGLMAFPFLALIVTIPYMVFQYRKFGSIPVWRSFLVYLFSFYLLCVFLFVILPLPESRTTFVEYAQTPQLEPFYFLKAMFGWYGFALENPSTWLRAFNNFIFAESLFNMFLLVPFGMFCRYYFKRAWWQTLAIGVALSLFFELTQLTGLYGYYSYPYRLFDVDDLILNTLGVMIGFWVMGPAAKLLPNMTVVDQEARKQGLRVSLVRRTLSFILDAILAEVTFVASLALAHLAGLLPTGFYPDSTLQDYDYLLAFVIWQIACWFIFYVIVPLILRGQTLGQLALKLVVVGVNAQKAPWYRILLRNGALFLTIVIPILLISLIQTIHSQQQTEFSAFTYYILDSKEVFFVASLIVVGAWLTSFPVRNYKAKKSGHSLVMLNELISGTRIMTAASAQSLSDRMVVLDVAEIMSLEYMISEEEMTLAALMERAGNSVSKAIRERNPRPTKVAVMCGSGNNGGDGWVVAHDLALLGYEVVVVSPFLPTEVETEPARSAAIRAFSVANDGKSALRIVVKPDPMVLVKTLKKTEVIVDALLGTGFSGQVVREPYESWIKWVNKYRANHEDAFVVSIDVPSGYSAQTGEHANQCIKADLTVTMLAYKRGLLTADAQTYCGIVKLSRLTDITPYLDRL